MYNLSSTLDKTKPKFTTSGSSPGSGRTQGMTQRLPATLWALVSVTYMVTKQVAMGKTSHTVGHFFLSFTHFQVLCTTKRFATSCTLVGFGISMHNKMHAQRAPCGQLQRAHRTLVGGLPMRVTVNLQPVLCLEAERSKTHAQLPIHSFSRNYQLMKMVKCHYPGYFKF